MRDRARKLYLRMVTLCRVQPAAVAAWSVTFFAFLLAVALFAPVIVDASGPVNPPFYPTINIGSPVVLTPRAPTNQLYYDNSTSPYTPWVFDFVKNSWEQATGASSSTSPGGTNGQVQYNNGGAFGGFTLSGDCTLAVPAITCTKTNGTAFTFWATAPDLSGDVTTSGSTVTTLAASGVTAGTYGDGSHTLTLTIDGKGRITAASVNALANTVTWPTTGKVVISNGTNTPAGVAEVDGDVLAGVSGSWAAHAPVVADCAGCAAPQYPGYTSGRLYTTYLASFTAYTSVTMTANTLYAMPFTVTDPTTFTVIGVFANGSPTQHAEVGIYANSAGVPTTLLLDAGELTLVANWNGLTISKQLAVGRYWLVVGSDGTPAIEGTTNASSHCGGGGLGATTASIQTSTCEITGAWTFSANNLPGTFPTVVRGSAGLPDVFLGD